ncbi:MAG TPA: thioester reductase domain-containing protein [Bryobacteraceae bacterium]|nr:thioester reductase domain-containing protein [Bryobacteraceae bacterium]
MAQEAVSAIFPLSVNQEGFWFLDQVEPGNPAYNIFAPLRVRGPLNSSLLELALNRVIERHESLRTTFTVDQKDGEPYQVIADTFTIPLRVIDLQHLPKSKRADEAHRQAHEFVQQPFDLSRPLFRVVLWRIEPEDHLFVPVMHHIISDFQSALIAVEETFHTYAAMRDGNDHPLHPLPVRYVDYAQWQRESLQNEVLEKQLTYWKNKLTSLPLVLSIPLDSQRPEKRTFRPAFETFELTASSIQPVRKLCRSQGVTLFTVLLAVFEALLHRFSAEEDMVVGVPIKGRNRSDLRRVIGCFANTLVFRTLIPPEITFLELLLRVRQTASEAYKHQDIPFTKLVEEIRPKRDHRYNPLVQVVFDYVKLAVRWDFGGGLSVESERQERGTTDLDLFVLLIEKEGTIHGRFGYNPDIFKPQTVSRLIEAYRGFLEQIVHDPAVPLARLELPKELESKPVSVGAVQPGVRIAATFSAEPVEPYLRFWFDELQRPSLIQFAPYNQVFQQLLDPGSLLAKNSDGLNVLLIRFEDWQRYEASTDAAKLERHTAELIDALRSPALRPKVPYLLCLCPPSPARSADTAVIDLFQRLEHQMAMGLSSVPGVHFVSYTDIEASYPVADYYDRHADQEGHLPYTDTFFAALATVIARKWDALTRSPYKVIVLDCDHTLWKGICGEGEGSSGVKITQPHRFLQEFVVRQAEQGMLLCLSSKNREEDVWSVFDHHTEMPLQRRHIISSRINWGPKSGNLKALSQELQVGLDTFIFIDDNPVECAEVRTHCPEVLTLQLPAHHVESFLENVWAFDRMVATQDDRQRTLRYQQEASRSEFRKRSATLEDFLDGLNLQVDIHPMRNDEIARVAQLTQRTNQFNCTTRRRTETEIRQIHCDGAYECLAVAVRDRFGNYGLVGVVIFAARESILAVDTFLLSCRVLGRGVEYLMMKRLLEVARDRGLAGIDVHYIPTDRNRPASDFLHKVAPSFNRTDDGSFVCRLTPDEAANVRYRPELTEFEPIAEAHVEQSAAASNNGSQSERLARYARTALQFDDVSKIVAAARAKQEKPASSQPAGRQPRNDVERRIVELISDVLMTDSVAIDDDFFDLGGSSIAAVQLLGKIARTFHVRLPLDRLFEKPTAIHLAAVIEEMQTNRRSSRPERPLVALKDEADLDPAICRTDGRNIQHADASRVLLTGATGFLGSFLLADLLKQTNARIYCLVRSNSPADAMEKLKRHLQSWKLWNGSFASRAVAVPADLTQPLFGLPRDYFNDLADTIDAVYHSGAYVDFIQPYSRLKGSNVTGTATVLRLAAQGRYKPVHFVSTVNVFSGADSSRIVYESDLPTDEQELRTGYDQSKWVAESLVNTARSRGIPANIYRAGPIVGHSLTGMSNAHDLLHRIISGGIRCGYMPDMDLALNLSPIDYVSGAIVQISRQPSALGKTFHLVNANTVNVRQVLDWIESSGYSFSRLPYPEWRERLLQLSGRDPDNPIYPLVPFFSERDSENDLRKPFFDAKNAIQALTDSSIKCPRITRELVQRYLTHLARVGSLPAPANTASHSLSESNDCQLLCATEIGC